MTKTVELSALPSELIVEILSHLEVPEIIGCTQLCSRMRDTINGSEYLQDEIDCYIEEQVNLYRLRDALPPELQAEDEATVLNNAASYMASLEESNRQLEERLERIFMDLQDLRIQTMGIAQRMLEKHATSEEIS